MDFLKMASASPPSGSFFDLTLLPFETSSFDPTFESTDTTKSLTPEIIVSDIDQFVESLVEEDNIMRTNNSKKDLTDLRLDSPQAQTHGFNGSVQEGINDDTEYRFPIQGVVGAASPISVSYPPSSSSVVTSSHSSVSSASDGRPSTVQTSFPPSPAIFPSHLRLNQDKYFHGTADMSQNPSTSLSHNRNSRLRVQSMPVPPSNTLAHISGAADGGGEGSLLTNSNYVNNESEMLSQPSQSKRHRPRPLELDGSNVHRRRVESDVSWMNVSTSASSELERLSSLEHLPTTSSPHSSYSQSSFLSQNNEGNNFQQMFQPLSAMDSSIQFYPSQQGFSYIHPPNNLLQPQPQFYSHLMSVSAAPQSAPPHLQTFTFPDPSTAVHQPQPLAMYAQAQKEWDEGMNGLAIHLSTFNGGVGEGIHRPKTAPLRPPNQIPPANPTITADNVGFDWLNTDPYNLTTPHGPPSPSKSPVGRKRSNSNLRKTTSHPNLGSERRTGGRTRLVESKSVDKDGTTWVNFTARDAREIMEGVAPSGASKRRKKEERERERLEKEMERGWREEKNKRIKKRQSMG